MKVLQQILTPIVLVIAIGLIFSCGGTKTGNTLPEMTTNPPFKVVDAYLQPWAAGVQQGGTGTDFHIRVQMEQQGSVGWNKVYYKTGVTSLRSGTDPFEAIGSFKDENSRPDTIMDVDPKKEAANTMEDRLGLDLNEGEVVISYSFNGEMNYYKLNEVEVKELLAYPGARPTDEQ